MNCVYPTGVVPKADTLRHRPAIRLKILRMYGCSERERPLKAALVTVKTYKVRA
jgi:hypothetical protein